MCLCQLLKMTPKELSQVKKQAPVEVIDFLTVNEFSISKKGKHQIQPKKTAKKPSPWDDMDKILDAMRAQECEFKSTKLGKDSIFYKTATKATKLRTKRATRRPLPNAEDWGAHNGA